VVLSIQALAVKVLVIAKKMYCGAGNLAAISDRSALGKVAVV
jgi:hypothetical protein